MNIILLSGGSGRRLWPLSNDAHSKQFLRLLPSPDSETESMVQRVLRQLREYCPEASVTIVTSITQQDILRNELGTGVDIVVEPERRNTFPAVVLSAGHLAWEQGCSADEPVVVMPCDAYAEEEYFRTIQRMAQFVEAGGAELALVGIPPESAAEEYGYIVPGAPASAEGDVLRVASFEEKPDTTRARRLIRQRALWNGGVFACRLGYLLKCLREHVPATSMEELRARYSELPELSFDRAVAEQEPSRVVMPLVGTWEDLGTWSTLADKLPLHSMGDVHLDTSCENTHAINVLNCPMLCVGTKDLMVVAAPDGILVVDKASCHHVKEHTADLIQRPMYEERRWGVYKVIDTLQFPDGHSALTKQLVLKAGGSISYQIHHQRDEVWTFVDGHGLLVLDGVVREVGRGDVIHILKGQRHAVKALSDLTFIEVQSGGLLVEEDIERFDWDWEQAVAVQQQE